MGKKNKRREKNPNAVPLGIRRRGVEEVSRASAIDELACFNAGKAENEKEQAQLERNVNK